MSIQDKAEAIMAAMKPETPTETVARYERGLRAIAASQLVGPDFGDWVQQTIEDMLDGAEAECPECGTVAHEGACVGEGD